MRKKVTSVLLMIACAFALITLSGCKSEDEKMIEAATESLISGLESDKANGYLNYYEILSSEIVEPYEENPNGLLLVHPQNVEIIYEMRLGNRSGDKGLIQVSKRSHVWKTEEGRYAEDSEEYGLYKEENFSETIDYGRHIYESKIAGLNSSVWSHAYQSKIYKSDIKEETKKNIASQLFRSWMDSFKEWGDNSFKVIQITDFRFGNIHAASDDKIADYKAEELVYPGSVNTWTFGADCTFKYVGTMGTWVERENSYGGGRAFGNDGVWQEKDTLFINTTNGFVMTEWEDCYTMDTISRCRGKILGIFEME